MNGNGQEISVFLRKKSRRWIYNRYRFCDFYHVSSSTSRSSSERASFGLLKYRQHSLDLKRRQYFRVNSSTLFDIQNIKLIHVPIPQSVRRGTTKGKGGSEYYPGAEKGLASPVVYLSSHAVVTKATQNVPIHGNPWVLSSKISFKSLNI
jgi:hypothetical protein